MHFERTADAALISRVLTHPKIYAHIGDDTAPPVEQFEPVMHPSFWYVAVYDSGELLGLFLLVPQGAACWEIHTCLLPSAWGSRALTAAKEVAAWVFEHTTCQRIVTTVPADNRLALRLASRAGMTEYGRNPASYLRRGQLLDTHLLGISKQQCQQQ